jgi:hypothetical protein
MKSSFYRVKNNTAANTAAPPTAIGMIGMDLLCAGTGSAEAAGPVVSVGHTVPPPGWIAHCPRPERRQPFTWNGLPRKIFCCQSMGTSKKPTQLSQRQGEIQRS